MSHNFSEKYTFLGRSFLKEITHKIGIARTSMTTKKVMYIA